MTMTQDQTIRETLQSVGKIDEIYEVKTFQGYRDSQLVTIRILDLGANCDTPDYRFICKAEQENGKKARGNGAPTVKEAIEIVHWSNLD
jgi:hypothetical protein